MTNIFEIATEFVDYDNRKFRMVHNKTSSEVLQNKFEVQLPIELIKDKTILDLGSCLGAAGHYSLTHGCKHYTGVEVQPYYFDTSNLILSKYWAKDKFEIIQQDVEKFLDNCIEQNIQYDYVLAAGIIYGFLDIVSIIKKISKVTRNQVLIETMNLPTEYDSNHGFVLITRTESMVKGDDSENSDFYTGPSSRISLSALDILMSTFAFNRTEEIILPKKSLTSNDSYHNIAEFSITKTSGPLRYIVRYNRIGTIVKPLNDILLEDSTKKNEPKKNWVFDDSVAKRFQQEAEAHIPSYHNVIDMCVKFANKNLKKDARIIDVGSALGYTMKRFIDEGYTNIIGVDNSRAMIDNSIFPELVIESDSFPKNIYDFVLANWTMHFIQDKYSYLTDIYNSLSNDGYLILTDKLQQSEIVKREYYDFKRKNGVPEEYIQQKEKDLIGIMHSVTLGWYTNKLHMVGFKTVEVIHADLGFVTFLCKKE
jgi:tRNA (cmo5U34)-methyltransferase